MFSEGTIILIPSVSGAVVGYFYLTDVFTILSFQLPRLVEVRVLDLRLSHRQFDNDVHVFLLSLFSVPTTMANSFLFQRVSFPV